MPGNNLPLYAKNAVNSAGGNASTALSATITAAANDFTGAGASNVLIMTADATAGATGTFLLGFLVKATGTNVASVARLFLNNGATNATVTNNTFVDEMPLPVTTAAAAGGTGPTIFWPYNKVVQPGFRMYVGLGTAVTGGWQFTPIYGDF